MYRIGKCNGLQILLVSLLLSGLIVGINAVEVELEMNYFSYFGGSGLDLIHSMTVDSSGNIIIAGVTHSTDLPLENAHRVSKEVEEAIEAAIPGADVIIHQDPVTSLKTS